MNFFRSVFIVMCLLCISAAGGVGAENPESSYRVLMTPFDVTSAADYAYLQDSVQTMVASRLANRDRVTIVDQSVSKKELASLQNADVAKKDQLHDLLKADYVLEGNLFALASGLNVKIALYPVQAEQEVHHYSIVVKKPENLITEIDRLVTEIVNENFVSKVAAADTSGKTDSEIASSGFVTAHPEIAYKRSKITGTVMNNGEGVISAQTVGSQKLYSFDDDVQSMVVTDADNDQVEDIFVLTSRTVAVLHPVSGKLRKVGEYALPDTMSCHFMQVADLNGDSKSEVYLSATDGLVVSSMILTWDLNQGFAVRQQKIPFYVRPLFIPAKGWRLLGQERGGQRLDFVKEGVYFLKFNGNGTIGKGEQLTLPAQVNLFDFVYADLDGDTVQEIVAIDQQEKLRVYNAANELLWVSDKNYGGSKTSIGPKMNEAAEQGTAEVLSEDEAVARKYVFVPGKLVVTDVNKDGKAEVVAAENVPSSWNLLKRFRLYKEGSIVALSWRGDALQPQWRTGIFDNYVADFSFRYVDSAASKMYVAYRSGGSSLTSFLPGMNATEIAVYELIFPSEKAE